MNETQIFRRRQAILSALTPAALSRTALAAKLKTNWRMAKPTLVRDLTALIDQGLVKKQGVGKSTVYVSLLNPLLKFIDRKRYFANNSQTRAKVKLGFDFNVFRHLDNLFTVTELAGLEKKLLHLSVQEKRLEPVIFKRELERFIVEFSWKSSRIEGNTYTLLETDILIRQMKEAEGHSREEAMMILNHKAVVEHILNHRSEFRRLTLAKVIKLHQILTSGLGVGVPVRNHPVAITGTPYRPLPEADSLTKALQQTIDSINRAQLPLTKALIASFMIAYIQPFSDGNKRTGRVLTNAILIAHDLYPLSYRDVPEIDYLESMVIFYEQNNLYHLKRIFTEQLEFSRTNYFRV